MNKIYLTEDSSNGIGFNGEGAFEVRQSSLGIDYAYLVKEDCTIILNKNEYECKKGDIFLKMYPMYVNGVRGLRYGIVIKSEDLFIDIVKREKEYELKYSNDCANGACADCESITSL